ncbi:MAG TPA: autotransporter outer membrane beta-barrel domain-containing protein [Caulobacteraceae bacterium]
MHRKRLVATVAAAPLLVLAHGAWAETTITTAVTTPVQTSTANDDLRITSSGSVKPTVTGPAVLLNSNDNVTNEGTVSTTGVNGSVGIQATGGFTGNVLNKGTISIVEDYTPTDEDPDGTGPLTGDGDLDGPFAQGNNRYGIRVTGGAGKLDGSVTQESGSITVEGNNSYGISIESGLTGDLAIKGGSISVIGGNPTTNATSGPSYGIRSTGVIDGDVTLRGSVAARGEGSVGVALDNNVGGAVTVQSSVSATGYRYSTRPSAAEDRAKLDADDLLIGGPAVRVAGDVAGGILLDARPADTDPDNADEDGDGIPDAQESTAAITSFGTAPALQIGSASRAVTIGAVGTGDDAYALINKGSINADGVFDNNAATALQIGVDGANATSLAGGVRNDATISARAYNADAAAVVLKAGAALTGAGVIRNEGTISAQTVANDGPQNLPDPLPGEEAHLTATGILLQAGSSAQKIVNTSVIAVNAVGENSDAVAIRDLSGSITSIETSGRIQAIITPNDSAADTDDDDVNPANETINGQRIAIDVAANTTGVTITQTGVNDGDDGNDGVADADADADGVDDADEPLIFGAVKLGSGADTLNLANGQLLGDVSFGDGADTLNITGGAVLVGKITDTDGALALNVTNGRLSLSGTDALTATSLNVGADGILTVNIDTETNEASQFIVDTANIATGAQLGVQLTGLLAFDDQNAPENYIIVDANDLTIGTIDDTLIGASPYLYNVGVTTDQANDNVLLSVRRRTAAEAGLNASQTAAFDAIYVALGEDEAVRDAFLSRTTREDFLKLYDQMLPDQGEGLFSALDYANLSIGRSVANRPDPKQRYGPDSFWIQELNMQVQREGEETLGSETKGFGFVGGYEAMNDAGGALGATLAYVTAEEQDDAAQVGEQTSASYVELGAYWRRAAGSWLFSVRGGGGYAFFDGVRRFIAPTSGVLRTAEAQWNGYTAGASGSVAYESRFGRYYVRPTLGVDYFYLNEDGRDETGNLEEGLNQHVDGRTSSRLSGTAEIAFGAEYGRDVWLRPEVRIGYRQVFAGEVGDTVARIGTGDPFRLVAAEPGDGAAVLGLALKAGTPMSYLALEAEVERVKNEQRYKALLAGRVMF